MLDGSTKSKEYKELAVKIANSKQMTREVRQVSELNEKKFEKARKAIAEQHRQTQTLVRETLELQNANKVLKGKVSKIEYTNASMLNVLKKLEEREQKRLAFRLKAWYTKLVLLFK